ncbi:hypothetical protein H8B09_13315 [Paenibacillus sp. PR3]|uniref:DUF1641 domain-containing protein n=1 Tax=Paenibacillus terricola TaxID=2763503 RepID=A0ABR8MUU7_9BACL|nr:hypothetical protein [Paenibacillus terricola]MBD3919738.1 hypothetical protein [Paenibacillus terricola]
MADLTTDAQIKAILESPEHKESLLYLINKLPELTDALQMLEDKTAFVRHVLSDKSSLSALADEAEDKWNSLQLSGEHASAILALTHKLPLLVESLEKAEEAASFVKQVVTDKQSLAYLAGSLKELPLVQEGTDILAETNLRYRNEQPYSKISIMRIFKLLKNPALVSGFRYFETLLEVVHKHAKNNKGA